MDGSSPNRPEYASRRSLGTWVHVGDAIEEVLDLLLAECEMNAERIDGMRGPVSAAARPWSAAIDQIEAEREGAGA